MRVPSFARELVHPLPLGAALLLALNDHFLKQAGVLPAWLTGKLSDVAGLFLAPLVLVAAARLVARRDGRWAKASAVATTAIVFAALKTTPFAHALYNRWIGPAVLDPTDLLALPACALSWWWIARFSSESAAFPELRPIATRAAFVVSALSCVATSKAYEPRPANAPPPPAPLPQEPCAEVRLVGDIMAPEPRVILHAQRLQYRDVCRLRIRAQEFVEKPGEGIAYEGLGTTTVDLTNDATTEIVIPARMPYATSCSTARTVRIVVDQFSAERWVSTETSAQMRQTCLPTQEVAAP